MSAPSPSCGSNGNQVTLQWTPPTNTGGQGVMITHYVLTGLPQSASCSTSPCDNITCPVWAPHSHKDILNAFKCVKIISGEWNAAYHDYLDQFGLVTLERRRIDLSLCLLYKYVNSMCYFPEGLISRRCNSSYNIFVLNIHCCSINHLLEQILIVIHSFLTRSLSGTLFLPIVFAPSFNSFKLLLSDCNL